MYVSTHSGYSELVKIQTAPRPRDAQATRERIVSAARTAFARRGYRSSTVKEIADAAGVSPNLITRYFGGKEGLFLAAAEPEVAVDDALTGPLSGFGNRLAASILARWADNAAEDPLLVLSRAAGEERAAGEQLARFLDEQSIARLIQYLEAAGMSTSQARSRAAAVDALVLGVSTRHRILRDDFDHSDLHLWFGAAIQSLID